jgi:hypothetical protein
MLRQHYSVEMNIGETLAWLDDRTEESVRSRMKVLGLKREYGTKPKGERVDSPSLTTECPIAAFLMKVVAWPGIFTTRLAPQGG